MVALISLADPSVEFDPVPYIDCYYPLTAYDLSVCIRYVHERIALFFVDENCMWMIKCNYYSSLFVALLVTELAYTDTKDSLAKSFFPYDFSRTLD